MSETTTPEIDIEELDTARGGGVLVDVREPGEYAAGHVPGAVLIPMGELATRMGEIDKATPVFVICASGNRSCAMTDLLRAAASTPSPWPVAPEPGFARAARLKEDSCDHDRPDHRPDRDADPG